MFLITFHASCKHSTHASRIRIQYTGSVANLTKEKIPMQLLKYPKIPNFKVNTVNLSWQKKKQLRLTHTAFSAAWNSIPFFTFYISEDVNFNHNHCKSLCDINLCSQETARHLNFDSWNHDLLYYYNRLVQKCIICFKIKNPPTLHSTSKI
jgi:hypothetical protein